MSLKNALIYSSSNILSQFLNFVSNFLVRSFLAPNLMGTWNLAGVIKGYIQPISLGVGNGAFRELPILGGQGNESEQVKCRSVALLVSLGEALVIAIGICIYLFFRRNDLGYLELYTLAVTAFLIGAVRVQEIYTIFFQGNGLYDQLSRALLLCNVTYAILLPFGTLIGGIKGLLLGTVVAESFRAYWLVRTGQESSIKVSLQWDYDKFKKLLQYGIGFRLTDYPNTFFLMLDMLWVTKFLDLHALGLYALAKLFFTQCLDIIGRIGNVFYTKTLTQYGQGLTLKKISRDIRQLTIFQIFVSVPLLCLLITSSAPFLIKHFIPPYAESIPLIFILLVGLFFAPQSTNLFTVWVAEKRLKSYGISNIFGVLTTTSSMISIWFLMGLRSLKHVALASFLGLVGYFLYMAFTAGRELWGIKGAMRFTIESFLAAGWITSAIYIFVLPSINSELNWYDDLLYSVLSFFKMLFFISPLLFYAAWATKSDLSMS